MWLCYILRSLTSPKTTWWFSPVYMAKCLEQYVPVGRGSRPKTVLMFKIFGIFSSLKVHQTGFRYSLCPVMTPVHVLGVLHSYDFVSRLIETVFGTPFWSIVESWGLPLVIWYSPVLQNWAWNIFCRTWRQRKILLPEGVQRRPDHLPKHMVRIGRGF